MYSRIRPLVTIVAFVATLTPAASLFAQGGCAAPTGTPEWLNTEVEVTGTKSKNAITTSGDQVTVKMTMGEFWVSYAFKAGDVKGVDRGANEDGVVRLTVDASNVQRATSTGDKGAAMNVPIDVPAEDADAVASGIQAMRQRCSK
jgi:hypothetical protein